MKNTDKLLGWVLIGFLFIGGSAGYLLYDVTHPDQYEPEHQRFMTFLDTTWTAEDLETTQLELKNKMDDGEGYIIQITSRNYRTPDNQTWQYGETALSSDRSVRLPTGNYTIQLTRPDNIWMIHDLYFNESYNEIQIKQDGVYHLTHELKELVAEDGATYWEIDWEHSIRVLDWEQSP